MSNKALLIVAHGSRRQQSNDEIKQLARALEQQSGQRFGQVGYAFLELTEPSIATGIDQCVMAGAAEIVVLPYFLAAGRHVAEDIPAIVKSGQEKYPGVQMRISTYLGASLSSMTDLILSTLDGEVCLCGKMPQECSFPDCNLEAVRME